ncbi:hypothetical protein QF038_000992 [Pseudarthrobacter sp. W1I19]|nr:hypothetical protein [Pseudarthrobacter sp. W1I19]
MSGSGDRAGRLAVELLKGVEAYDARAVTKALNRIIPRNAQWVIASLAVIALVNLKRQHGEDWPQHVIPSLVTYDREAP